MTRDEFVQKLREFGQPEARIKFCLESCDEFIDKFTNALPDWKMKTKQEQKRITDELFSRFASGHVFLAPYYPPLRAELKKQSK
ncbi:hypothetical protein [Pyramidobacter piscolens]|uniref:hypothetical protein n=1 Tax=Pyramidobacter piscolens TaxID=638849 RepID=UPI002AB1BD5F|nr:hypothetical protein [Pyramidobacter piscolens]